MAGTITVSGVPDLQFTPGSYVRVIFGGSGGAGSPAPLNIFLAGNMIAAAITGAAPSFSVAAGSEQTGGTPHTAFSRLSSADDALAKYGEGSELHAMARGVFRQWPDAEVYSVAVPEATSGAVRASGAIHLAFATGSNPTVSGTIRFWIAGEKVELTFTTADTVASLSAAIAAAILAKRSLPVTAQYAAGPVFPVTLTAKHPGTRGNDIALRGQVEVSGVIYDIPSQAAAYTSFATYATVGNVQIGFTSLSDVTGGIRGLANGAGSDAASLATVLGRLTKTRVHRLVTAANSATTGADTDSDVVSDWLTQQAGPLVGLNGQAVMATRQSLTTADNIPAAVNNPRLQVVFHPKSEDYLPFVAAQVAAARVAGDGAATNGDPLLGEKDDPAANLDGLRLRDVRVAPYESERIDGPTIELALHYGLTPLAPSGGRPGYSEVTRSITTRYLSDTGALDYGVLDTSNVSAVDAVVDRIKAAHAVDFRGFKLTPDDPDGLPPKTPRTTTPSLVRAWIHARLKESEGDGIIAQVDANLPLLKVEGSNEAPGRTSAEIPMAPVQGYHVFAANARQLPLRF